MKLSGWIFMILVWTGILSLAAFSFAKLILAKEKRKLRERKQKEDISE